MWVKLHYQPQCDEQKLANEGTMNLAECRKPKKVKVQDAQNLQCSGREVSSHSKITLMMLSVTATAAG